MEEVIFLFGSSRENAARIFEEIKMVPDNASCKVCQIIRVVKRDNKLKCKESYISGTDYDILKKSGRMGILKGVMKSIEKYNLASIPKMYRAEEALGAEDTHIPGLKDGGSLLVLLAEEIDTKALNALAKTYEFVVVRYKAAAVLAWSKEPYKQLSDEQLEHATEEYAEVFDRMHHSFESMNTDHNRWHWNKDKQKKLILVTSPPASGKTYISKQLSKALEHVVYLDKDSLIPLSNRVFAAGNQEVNRSSEFFEQNIRDAEYETIIGLAFEALEYDDFVLINAPFSREIRDVDYINTLKSKLAKMGARLVIVWVHTEIEVCRQRMIERNSERDIWKVAHWDEYIGTRDFSIPRGLDDSSVIDDFLVFKNSNEEQYKESMKRITYILEHY